MSATGTTPETDGTGAPDAARRSPAIHPPEGPPTVQVGIHKAPTGIAGLDEVTHGGLPRGRPALVCGGPGSGKTLFGMQFLVHGAGDDEPGVFLAFEETADELASNTASLGFDIARLVDEGRLVIDRVEVDRANIRQAGAFDLEGLFIRLGHAIDRVGAKRVVLDTLETLLDGLPDEATLRAELQRLFRWLKDRGVTCVVTAERGDGALTRRGMEEYASDCVISLEQNVVNQVATRRLRIVKYRGSAHGTNLYPFIIDDDGFTLAPITGARVHKAASHERVSLGVAGLDDMIGGLGPYRGNTILVSGTAGTGKTTLAAHFVDAACQRGERAILYSFEQSPDAIIRDTGALGRRLAAHVEAGLLRMEGHRPTSQGLDMHLAIMRRHIRNFRPSVLALDPITGFGPIGSDWETKNMLLLLLDAAAEGDVTLMMTSLTDPNGDREATRVGISSLADAWILLRDVRHDGVRHRSIYVLKSRGIGSDEGVREYVLQADGMHVRPSTKPPPRKDAGTRGPT